MARGEVLLLAAGGATAEVHPTAGGRLGQLDLGDGPLLRGWAPGLGWSAWGCFPLLPWSNRLPGGHLVWAGIDHRFDPDWPDGSAIHGLVASSPWSVGSATTTTAHLVVDASSGPYVVRGEQRFALDREGLTIHLGVRNDGDRTVPAGLGVHPWFRAGVVRVPAAARWPGEPLPTGPPVPVAGVDDLRPGRVPGPMDRCHTELEGTSLEAPGVVLSWEGPVTQVVVYTGEPGWVALEPATMANDGFRLARAGATGHGVVELAPGETLAVTYRFSPAPEGRPTT